MSVSKKNKSINQNQMTVIHQQAYRKSKSVLRRLAQDDPSAILRGLASLFPSDRRALGYLAREAHKWREISKQNILKFLTV